jgi:hypothetical protein
MTLRDIENIDREYLLPDEVAKVLGSTGYSITIQAREDRKNGVSSFPFPVVLIGNRVKIPKRPFLAAMRGETS